jgi:hypothetical protein
MAVVNTLSFHFSQALMADAVKTPNVVEATNKPGLYDKLEALKKRWVPYMSRPGFDGGRSLCPMSPSGQDGAKPPFMG